MSNGSTNTGNPGPPADPSGPRNPALDDEERQALLVTQLIEADEERRRRRRSGSDEPTTIPLCEELTPYERDDLARMLQCAEQLEQLAARDAAGHAVTRQFGEGSSTEQDAGGVGGGEDYHIGHYHVLRRIADGGFGAVLLAIDERNQRRVALKVPRPDILLTGRLLERFLIEGRAAATLNHPNIVAVYETLSEPVPAIAFEYCEGGTLSRFADRVTDEQTAIQIVLRLAEALQHAHTRGILHRDVKPGNVLLVHADTQQHENAVEIEGAWWIPKLGDFGLAKLLDESVHQTQSGVVMGTPQFMAPEQAAGRVSELGTHTDVFSLGAIMYWLLAGHPPFEGHGTLQTLKLIETTDAQPLRRLRRDVSPKTEAVCLKCLRRPIDARYPSAAALAEDLRHLLSGEPVTARPPNVVERVRQWRRHNPTLALFAIMLPLAAACGLLLQWSNNRALQQYIGQLDAANRRLILTTQQAQDARLLAQRRGYASDLQLAQRGLDAGDLKTYHEALDRHVPVPPQTIDIRGPEWQELWGRGHPAGTEIDLFPSAAYCANLSSDGRYLAASGADGTFRVYETDTWKRVASHPTGQQEVNYAAFSSDGELIATAGDDGTIAVWNWREGIRTLHIEASDTLMYCVQFYADDTRLASCGRNEVIGLWDAGTGELKSELSGTEGAGRFEQLDVSEDGRWLAAVAHDGQRRVWNLETGRLDGVLSPVGEQPLSSIALFERDEETWMVSGTLRQGSRSDCSVIIEVVGSEDQRILPIHFDGIHSVAVDRAGQLALAGDSAGRISLVDINTAIRGRRWWYPETIRRSWVGHTGRVYGLALTEDGRIAISAGDDGRLVLWDTDGVDDSLMLTAQHSGGRRWVHAVVASPDSIYLVEEIEPGKDDSPQYPLFRWSPATDELIPILDAATSRPLQLELRTERAAGSLAVFADRLFGRSADKTLCCWKINGDLARREWSVVTDDPEAEVGGTYEMALSPDGRQLAVCRRGHPVHNLLIDTQTGSVLETIPVEGGVNVVTRAIAFDAEGTRLAFGNEKDVFVYDLQTKQQTRLSSHSDQIRQVCFIPGKNMLVSGAADRRICVWDLDTGAVAYELTGHRGAIECLGLHPHADRLVSADDGGWVRIWSLLDGILLSEVPPPSDSTYPAACGKDLVGISGRQTVFLKHLVTPQ